MLPCVISACPPWRGHTSQPATPRSRTAPRLPPTPHPVQSQILSKVEAHIDYLRAQLLSPRVGQDHGTRPPLAPGAPRAPDASTSAPVPGGAAGVVEGGADPGVRPRAAPAHDEARPERPPAGADLTEAQELRLNRLLRSFSSAPPAATPAASPGGTSATCPRCALSTPRASAGEVRPRPELRSDEGAGTSRGRRLGGDGALPEAGTDSAGPPPADGLLPVGGGERGDGGPRSSREGGGPRAIVRATDRVVRELFGDEDPWTPGEDQRLAPPPQHPARDTCPALFRDRRGGDQGVTKRDAPPEFAPKRVLGGDGVGGTAGSLGARGLGGSEGAGDDLEDISDGGFHSGCWRRKYARGEMR